MDMASGNTWGIASGAFIGGFALLSAVAGGLLVLRVRRALQAGRVVELSPDEIALVNGGTRLAVVVALSRLRSLRLVRPDGTVDPVVAPPAQLDPLDEAVLGVLRLAKEPVDVGTILTRPAVLAALEQMITRLEEERVLNEPGGQRRAVMAGLPFLLVIALGAARLVAGLHNHKPVGFLVVVLIADLAVYLIFLFAPTQAPILPAGKKAVTLARRQNWKLNPRLRPSTEVYGAASVVMAVALFGGASLYLAEPAFAQAVAAPEQAIGVGSASAGGVDVGGSSCGGGGSSCGGGCGGGGCGG